MPKYYFNEVICKDCGGKCCKSLPGFCTPKDIIRLFPSKSLKASVGLALNSGKFCVDWYEDSPIRPFIRPATKDKIGLRYDPSWGGECVFLTETGCTLPKDLRPHTCKKLEPKGQGAKCDNHYKINPKLAIAKAWKQAGIKLLERR